jgi:hypothetical protein
VSIGAGGIINFNARVSTAGGPTQILDANNNVLAQAGGGGAGQNGTDAFFSNGGGCSNGTNGAAGAGGVGGSGTNIVGRSAAGQTPPTGSIVLPNNAAQPGVSGYALLIW